MYYSVPTVVASTRMVKISLLMQLLGWKYVCFICITVVKIHLQIPLNTVLPKEKSNGSWLVEEYYCLGTDKMATEEEKVMFIVYNGTDFYLPAVPDCIGYAHEFWVKFGSKLDELRVLNSKMKAFLPEGALQKGYKDVGLCLKGAKRFLERQCIFTGDGDHESLKMICHQIAGPPGKKRKIQVGLDSSNLEPNAKETKKPYNVCFCGQQVEDSCALSHHLTSVHPNSTNWKCTSCDKVLTTSTNMWKHYRTQHLDLWLYRCNKCSAPGSKSDEMSVVMKHLADKHGGPKAGIVCPKCQNINRTATAMRKHNIGCGNKDKHFPCTHMIEEDIQCEKSFREKSALAHHVKVNHGKDPLLYQCTLCDRAYEYSQGLKYHMTHHSHPHSNVANPVAAAKEKADNIVRELAKEKKRPDLPTPNVTQKEAVPVVELPIVVDENVEDDPDKTKSAETSPENKGMGEQSSSDHEGRGDGFSSSESGTGSSSESGDEIETSMETEVTFRHKSKRKA